MLVDLDTAKLHLRVIGTDDDSLTALYISAAAKLAVGYIQRNIYADAPALAAAVTDAPVALAAATVVYDAAILAAEAMDAGVDQDMAVFAADEAYTVAKTAARMTHQGVVIDEQIQMAILLTVGHLFENREDSVVGLSVMALPMGSAYFLQPYRVY